jgi:hypothetical protein
MSIFSEMFIMQNWIHIRSSYYNKHPICYSRNKRIFRYKHKNAILTENK